MSAFHVILCLSMLHLNPTIPALSIYLSKHGGEPDRLIEGGMKKYDTKLGSLFRDLATQVGDEEEQVELSGFRPNLSLNRSSSSAKNHAPVAAESVELGMGTLHPPPLSYPDARCRPP